ncbi:MAG: DNA-3-methyladenine glycosylase [Candidatus Omnitrophica bacterium]|nr:DNA-3-methyladenine glycosylase [Candidatus Omnitrophota bacterium]MCM8827219.1 DNA-3-methyladenine glycosylase [Candidatus Omnitrophota bacterium]
MLGVSYLKINQLKKNKRGKDFFRQNADLVAKELLGDYLVLMRNKDTLIGVIVETEAYLGVDDDASHAFGGKITERNKIMYCDGGVIYVYLIYGKYFCFNIVVSKKGDPQSVFIRAVEPILGIEIMKKNRGISNLRNLTNGPCRWTQAFGIDKYFLGKSICGNEIFISRDTHKEFSIGIAKRIGIEYASNSKNLPLRFYIKNNTFVSKN